MAHSAIIILAVTASLGYHSVYYCIDAGILHGTVPQCSILQTWGQLHYQLLSLAPGKLLSITLGTVTVSYTGYSYCQLYWYSYCQLLWIQLLSVTLGAVIAILIEADYNCSYSVTIAVNYRK